MAMLRFTIYWLTLICLLTACGQTQEDKLPAILYLNWDENGRIQLYQTEIDAISPIQLTESQSDILSFAPAPNGQRIIYSTGDELWLIVGIGRSTNQLLTCSPAQCSQIVWHPDGRRLLYERTETDFPTRLWWLDSETGKTVPLQEENTSPSQAASFSPNGDWVSYFTSPDQGIEFYNFDNGRQLQVSSILGTPATWHPTEPVFLYRDQRLVTLHGNDDSDHQGHSHNYAQANYLFVADVDGQSSTAISGDGIIGDDSPAWSPEGDWIILGRKHPGTASGQQLWLMRSDGSEARPVTSEPVIHHGVPKWSGDGRFILYQRFDTAQPEGKPGIWLLELATGNQTEIADVGFLPTWLP